VGRLRAYGNVEYCYNLGSVTSTGGGKCTGGIVGENHAYDGSALLSERASSVEKSYNVANVTSNGTGIGGIVGYNRQYCYVKNCYQSKEYSVKKGSTSATENVGSSSDYLGKIIGYAYSTSTTYVTGNGILTTMPTVYNVVNGLSDADSQYWSKSDLNAPKLLWEE